MKSMVCFDRSLLIGRNAWRTREKAISQLWLAMRIFLSGFLPPQGSGPEAGIRGGTPNVPRVKKKYRIGVLLVWENFLDLMKLGAQGGPG